MFRPSTPYDISQAEFKKYIEPHHDAVETYLKNYVIPDYCAFFIVSAYRNQWEEDPYDIFINSAMTFFNIDNTKKERIIWKKKITEILNIKYGLMVINEDPLQFEEYSP